jgi:hypothetical protein
MSGSRLEGIQTLFRIASYSKLWFLPIAIITACVVRDLRNTRNFCLGNFCFQNIKWQIGGCVKSLFFCRSDGDMEQPRKMPFNV